MKKGKIIGISLLSILIAFSFINTTTAAPSYVGVNTGNAYTWVGSVDMASVNGTAIALLGAENWTLAYNMLNEMINNETGMEISTFLAAGLKAEITNVTDEVSIPFNSSTSFPGVGIFYDVSFSVEPNVWGSSSPSVAIMLDPVNMNSTNFVYFLFSGGPPLFLPKGVNYNNVATWAAAALASYPPLYNNITLSALTDGFEITISGAYLEWALNDSLGGSGSPFPLPSLTDITATVKWNTNGVLSYADVSFMGFTLLTFQLISDNAEIPGFAIPIFLGASTATIIGVIYTIRRKKRVI